MELKRVLGAGQAGWIVAGSMIGAGIFYTPGLVAARLPGLVAPVGAWVLGGLLALCGAMVYGELGSRWPEAGGDYRYLAATFGPPWGFLTGWAAFTMTFSAAVAAMAIVAIEYGAGALAPGRPLPAAALKVGAPLLLLLLTWANVLGARVAGRATTLLTALPVAGLMALFAWGLLRGAPLVVPSVAEDRAHAFGIAGLGAALVPIFFTYSGWNAAAYLAGEVREPSRNLPRALIVGTASVTALYVAFNVVVLVVVPAEELAGATTAGALVAEHLLGPAGERWLSAVIALAVTGTANVTLMAGSRIYYAMAADGLAPRSLRHVNDAGVPSVALWVSGVWTAVLSLSARVDVLVNWATLAMLLLSALTVVSLFVQRARQPLLPGAYHCFGYPWVPGFYLVAALGVAISSATTEPAQALAGLAVLACGGPLYLWLRR